jgi:hypothetical protein
MPVYIKKYTGTNYFSSDRNAVDKITVPLLPDDSLPHFGYETEDENTLGQYLAGDYDLTVSLMDLSTSTLGLNIRNFLLGSDRDFFLVVCMVIGDQSFCGTVQAGQIRASFDNLYATLTVKDILLEWANRCSIVANSTINWGSASLKTFEEYILMHFAGLTSDVVIINLPANTYLSRLQPYGNPGECFAYKDFYNFITGQTNISRWETFKELAKGFGFRFEMYLNPGTETLSNPEFIFNIFFITDLLDSTPITLEITSHNEHTTGKRLEWLYLRYRYFVLSGVSYCQGILFNSAANYYTDTDQSNGVTLYPAITMVLDDRVITVTDAAGNAIKTVYNKTNCTEFELKNYTYSLASGGGIGKLYPLTEAGVTGGGMAYSHIFHTTIAPTRYDFNPIQRYAITQYKKYLKGLQKAKDLKVIFDSSTQIKLWKRVVMDDGFGDESYYISAVRNIDLGGRSAEVELTKIAE